MDENPRFAPCDNRCPKPKQSLTSIPDSFPLEPRKTHFLSSSSSSVEVLEGTMKILKRLLWCALGAFIHPRELCPLQTVQKFVLLHEVSETVLVLVVFEELDALVKTPVVGKTSSTRMSIESSSLSIVWVQLVSVGTAYQHFVFAASNARLARFLTERGPYNLAQKRVKTSTISCTRSRIS